MLSAAPSNPGTSMAAAAAGLAPCSLRPPAYQLFRSLAPAARRQLQSAAAAVGIAAVAAEAAAPAAVAAEAAAPAVAAEPVATPSAPSAADQFVSWAGLHTWRARGVDARTAWGPKGPVVPDTLPAAAAPPPPLPASLAECARAVLLTPDPRGKAELTHRAWAAYCEGRLPLGAAAPIDGPPARPPVPELVPPRRIPSMDKSPLPKAVYMLHNLTHVELNAIDLAWDTLLRFSRFGLPPAFYADFARVADDESRHLEWCLQRLGELGYEYGSMPAHNLLWEGAEASAGDLGARLAIVPMSQEARGLDAGDRLAKRLVGMGDNRTAAIVWRIAEEERAHVAVGVTWFTAVCAALGRPDPAPAFRALLLELCPGLLKGPFNDAERQVVGLRREWYDAALWEPGQAAAASAALAATVAAERAGQPPPTAVPLGGSPAAALAPVSDPQRLQQLAARLGSMLELELGNAGMGP